MQGDNLFLRVIENEKDIERAANFNATQNNRWEGATYGCLHRYHPYMARGESCFFEDALTGEIVSTVCIIPWEFEFCGVALKAAQIEMVLTHPDYRNRGLVRRQIEYLEKNFYGTKYNFGIIWGIPFYYRQFGYAYCVYGNGCETLEVSRIPEAGENISINLRRADEGDTKNLKRIYDDDAGKYEIHLRRDENYWRYLINAAKNPVYVFGGGYITFHRRGDKIIVYECCFASGDDDLNRETGLALLKKFKDEGAKEIIISGPEKGLAGLAKSLGSEASQPEQWLVKIASVSDFIKKIAPVLEKRVGASRFAGFTEEIIINLYKRAIKIEFVNGNIDSVADSGFLNYLMGAEGGADICIPGDAFTRLAFGFKTSANSSTRGRTR